MSRTVSTCFVSLLITDTDPAAAPAAGDFAVDATTMLFVDGSTLMLVGVPETATVVAPITVLLAASISVTRFCEASRTRTRFAPSLSASAVGSPPTWMRILMSFVAGSRASTAAPGISSTYMVLLRELKTICWADATIARSPVGFGRTAIGAGPPPDPRLATMTAITAVTAIRARAAIPRTGAGR